MLIAGCEVLQTERTELVRRFLEEKGVEFVFRIFNRSTESSFLAAEALGCTVPEIAKSIVLDAGSPVVVIISGDKKVDLKKVAYLTGRKVSLASADYVLKETGYEIGGVPPFPHREKVRVMPDSSLRRFEYVWAAGGERNAVFKINVRDLVELAGGNFYDLAVC